MTKGKDIALVSSVLFWCWWREGNASLNLPAGQWGCGTSCLQKNQIAGCKKNKKSVNGGVRCVAKAKGKTHAWNRL
jgi:hypothetical protein